MSRTYSTKPAEVKRDWWVIDADGKVLGRVAVEAAILLRGKHKPIYAPHVDAGDFVVIVNAAKARLTGNKLAAKFAYRHSGYPGGIKAVPYEKLMRERPERAMEKAVLGMLPHNRLGRAMGKKLKVYSGPDHPHGPQNPKVRQFGKEEGSKGAV